MAKTVSATLLMLASLPGGARVNAPGARRPAATAPATSPAAPMVRWHPAYEPAAAEARKRGVLLLVVYHDPGAPASQTFEEVTLSDPQTRRFLSGFAAARLNATTGPGRKRFAATGADEAPLIRVFSPKGELLDSRRGCIIPPSAFRRRLELSLAYRRAATTRPFDPAARWRAVGCRLDLATRHKAAGEIDKLLALPAEKLPRGVTGGGLHLAKGKALFAAAPKQAEKCFEQARRLGPGDPDVAGEAMLDLADLCFRTERHTKAHRLCSRYLAEFPKAPAVGRAWYTKALVELLGMNKPAEAAKTLTEFIERHPEDDRVVKARKLLKSIGRAGGKDARK